MAVRKPYKSIVKSITMVYSTIQIAKELLQRLSKLKEKYKAKSYNELVAKLVEKEESVPESMFGSHPEMKKKLFTKKDEAEFHAL